MKGLLDGKSSGASRDVIGASGPYETEMPLSGIRLVGHRDPEEIQNMYEACSPLVSYFSTSSAVPGMVGVTDAIASIHRPLEFLYRARNGLASS